MSCLIKVQTKTPLTAESLSQVLRQLKEQLNDRVDAAYIFGSASTGTYRENSDIDLIFVKDGNLGSFVERAFAFEDILDLFPRMDILVYTPQELEQHLADSDIGFWKAVRVSMKKLI